MPHHLFDVVDPDQRVRLRALSRRWRGAAIADDRGARAARHRRRRHRALPQGAALRAVRRPAARRALRARLVARGGRRRPARCMRGSRAPIRRRRRACTRTTACASDPRARSARAHRPAAQRLARRARLSPAPSSTCASSASTCRAPRSTRASTRAAEAMLEAGLLDEIRALWAARLRPRAAAAAQHRLPRARRPPARRVRPTDGARGDAAGDAPVRQAPAHLVPRPIRRGRPMDRARPRTRRRRSALPAASGQWQMHCSAALLHDHGRRSWPRSLPASSSSRRCASQIDRLDEQLVRLLEPAGRAASSRSATPRAARAMPDNTRPSARSASSSACAAERRAAAAAARAHDLPRDHLELPGARAAAAHRLPRAGRHVLAAGGGASSSARGADAAAVRVDRRRLRRGRARPRRLRRRAGRELDRGRGGADARPLHRARR